MVEVFASEKAVGRFRKGGPRRVELAYINTGAVHPGAKIPRGIDTFQTIDNYPWSDRCKKAPAEPIVEVTVPYSLPPVERFVVDVTTR